MPKTFIPVLILSLLACCIELEISVPSFPDIATHFSISENLVQLIVTYNFLGFSIASLFYGPFSDCYGRRKIMIIGNALLLIGAIGCALAPTIYWLLTARFIQGLGASASAVVVFAMVADVYSNSYQEIKCIAIMNCLLTASIAASPLLGGWINQTLGWRANFWSVALICCLSWITLVLLLPETKSSLQKLDFSQIFKNYCKIFRHKCFLYASVTPSLLYSGYLSFVISSPFLYRDTFELSMPTYIIHQACIIIIFSFVSLISNKVIVKFGKKTCSLIGGILCFLASCLFIGISLTAPYSPYCISITMAFFCIGFALSYPILFTLSLDYFPDTKGVASSAIMSMRALLTSGITGLTSYCYQGKPIQVSCIIWGVSTFAFVLIFKLWKAGQFTKTLALLPEV